MTSSCPVLTLVHDADVDGNRPQVERTAVRAVLTRGPEILLLGTREGHLKFPGGGVEDGETRCEALRRELREECGITGVEIGDELVTIVELAQAQEPGHLFRMTSHYYWCAGGRQALLPDLSADERVLGLTPRWLTPAEAVAVAVAAEQAPPSASPRWAGRDLTVLRRLAG